MKKIIITIVLALVSIASYGQSYGNDGIIERISKDGDTYRVVMHPYTSGDGFEVTGIDIEGGKVMRMRVKTYQGFLRSVIRYFELEAGMRNLGENNLTTAVYRSKLYEYRISTKGADYDQGTMIIELIKK
jgi:hypothetical protein